MVASLSRDAMEDALAHLASLGFAPGVIADVGASNGSWSIRASRHFPAAQFYLFEPLRENERPLAQLAASDARFHYFLTALGAETGESTIYATPDRDGSSILYWDGQDDARRRAIPITTLDALIGEGRVAPPDLVKIDVQGFELEVLKGAAIALKSAQALIIEVSLYEFLHQTPRAHEVIAFLAARDFYLFDVAGMLRRPYDNSLGQMDLVFAAAASPIAASKRWM
jgi:FkbM family methyltransferase